MRPGIPFLSPTQPKRFQGEITLLFLAILTLLAPPPLCACWLTPDRAVIHPHFSEAHAESEHAHTYLFDMFPTTHPDWIVWGIIPVQFWIALALMGSLWRRIARHHWWEEGWLPLTLSPPPEGVGRLRRSCYPGTHRNS